MTLSNIQRNIRVLHSLKTANASTRKRILENAHKDVIKAIVECVYNILFGDVSLTSREFNRLKKEKETLRELVKKKPSLKKKKALIIQKGGALPAILGPALALAITLLQNVS